MVGIAGCPLLRWFELLKSMEIRSRHSEMSVILQVSTIEGCLLGRVPLQYDAFFYHSYPHMNECDVSV